MPSGLIASSHSIKSLGQRTARVPKSCHRSFPKAERQSETHPLIENDLWRPGFAFLDHVSVSDALVFDHLLTLAQLSYAVAITQITIRCFGRIRDGYHGRHF